jgi:glutamate synthase (NADPH/NADH) small chain
LTQQTKSLYGEEIPNQILATGKDVIVIGGGDTGSDCRNFQQTGSQIYNFEIMPKPPVGRSETTPGLTGIKNILFTSGRL